jgi:MFS family permease
MPLPSHYLQQFTTLPALPGIVVGILLLFLGRKLFWLFVGAVGFVVGMEFAAALYPHQPDWSLIVGAVLGLIGAATAIFVQKVAIGIAGFLAGGYFLMTALRTWEMQAPDTSWLTFLIGGAIGAVLMYVVFHWALIILSAISGAHLILHPFALSHTEATVAFVVLGIIGIMAQGKMLSAPRTESS